MNERIRELAEQAGATVLTTHGVEGVVDGCYVIGPARLEKFAKLVVKECMQMCQDEYNEFIETSAKNNGRESDFAFGSVNSAERIKNTIKEHFGVEE